jgi:hypothetical protein
MNTTDWIILGSLIFVAIVFLFVTFCSFKSKKYSDEELGKKFEEVVGEGRKLTDEEISRRLT